MKKILLFSFCFLFISSALNIAKAQCSSPCPFLFILSDSIGCNNVEVRKGAVQGTPYTNLPFAIRSCKNTKMKYTLNVDPVCYAGISYQVLNVVGGTLIAQSSNMFTIQWGAASIGNLIIKFTTPGSSTLPACTDTINLTINLLNKPVAAFTSSPQPACFNNPTVISFNSAGSLYATNFLWNFGDGFTSTLPNPTHAYTLPGSYIVTLIVANTPATFNGLSGCPTCVDSVKHTVIINNLPGPNITCVASVCAGATETYCTNDLTCGSYVWSVIGGTIQSGQGTACVTIKWGSGVPQGSLTLVASGCTTNYCPQGTTVSIPIIPISGVIIGANLVCINTYETYTLPAWPGTTYNWILSSGGVITPYNTNTNSININWTTIGTHTITCNYYDSTLKCGGTGTYNVFVRPIMTITGANSVCVNSNSNLTSVRPTNIPVTSNWTISPAGATIVSGNGTSTINVNWANAGTYVVTAAATVTNTVCTNASYIVTVLPAPIISAVIGKDSICPGGTYIYKAISNAVGIFNWSFSNVATFSLLGVNNDSVQVVWAAAGPYSITVNQNAIPSNCISNTFVKNIFRYPSPNLLGATTVCADDIQTYTITNILNGNFQWSIIPASFGTIISGQGTNTVQIKWHGNNAPGSSNTVTLNYGVCNNNSIPITINEPPVVNIVSSGTLCGVGGISLNSGVGSGVFTWTGPGVPPPGNTSSITGVTIPGNYTVQIQNINGTGCTVSASYAIPNVGRPVASISANNILNYCLPSLPNMNLIAVNGPGYTFQWYLNNILIPSATNAVLPVNTLTSAGSYTYNCVVSLGGCIVTSNVLTITITTCVPGGPGGCIANINVTNITGCNPFALSIAAIAPPAGSVLNGGSGNPSILHLEDGYLLNGNTTRIYSSIGFKQVRICADVLLPNTSICRVCKDTTVNVTVAANFSGVVNCKKINLYDASTVVFPATISSYQWSLGTNPGNFPVLPIVGSFNNSSIPNPIATFTQSGSYIVTLTVKSGSCIVTHMDTFSINVPNANFSVANSCVGTNVNFNNLFPSPTNYWDFGDAATSYTSPTFHAYATPNIFNVTHIVTNALGCKDTVVKPITIVAAPVCTVTYSTPLTFCFKDSVVLGSSCTGLINFQWYNNGVAISGANFSTDTVKQTGNYHFIAYDINGCKIISDTVAVNVNQSPNVAIISSGSVCAGSSYTTAVPSCVGCTYIWKVDGNFVSSSNQYSAIAGTAPYTVGAHNIFVQVINSFGCIDTSSINVTFYALPTVSISVIGPTPYCSNNLYTLNAVTNAASPTWAWTLNNIGIVLSNTNSLQASAAGNYFIKVTDGITGCINTAVQTILPSPELNLFPIGCDTLCDTTKLFLPLQSLNGNLTGYNIDWYDNAPPYGIPVGNGVSFPLNTLSIGNHNISVIVTSPNGCMDTSNVYSIKTFACNIPLAINDVKLRAKLVGDYALLNFTTEQENNIDYFIIEQSLDGNNFEYASKIWSKGNSTNIQYYTANVKVLEYNKPIFYRIKMVDKNGKITYSNIDKILATVKVGESMIVIPSITANNAMLMLQSNSILRSELNIYSAEGKLISKQLINIKKGMNTIPINLVTFPVGLYFISTETIDKKLTTTVIKK